MNPKAPRDELLESTLLLSERAFGGLFPILPKEGLIPDWTPRQLRGIQCILNATHGVVGPKRPFFERAFGESADEFRYIIEQPDEAIFDRTLMPPYKRTGTIQAAA